MRAYALHELLAALAFFRLFGVLPIVVVLLRHQRSMAELIHRNVPNDAMQRLASLEREVRELKAERIERLLREDSRKVLGRHSP